MTDYLLIAQKRCHVEHYARQSADTWLLTEFKQLDQVVDIRSIDCRLALIDIFEKVEFSPEDVATSNGGVHHHTGT